MGGLLPCLGKGDRTSNHGGNDRIDGWLEPAVLIAERALVTCRKAFPNKDEAPLYIAALRPAGDSLRSGGGVKGHYERRYGGALDPTSASQRQSVPKNGLTSPTSL